MATCALEFRRGTRPWMWPNLLSLDAPIVAVLWQIFFVRCFHADADLPAGTLLVLAVWLIYVADRVLDAWRGTEKTPRHRFYHRHWRSILPIWGVLLAGTGWLAWEHLSGVLFRRGLGLLVLVIFYFSAVHAIPERFRRIWPKEFAVAILFALGASLAAWTKIQTAADVITIFLFSCLCWINCAAIDYWERDLWESGSCLDNGRSGSRGKLARWPIGLAGIAVGVAAGVLLYEHRPVLGAAEAVSAIFFVWLDRARWRLSADALRVLADVALLSPVLFLPLAGMRW